MKKIVHIITGLNNGGAEMMLFKLLANLDQNKYQLEVISMTDMGYFGPKIQKLGIPVHPLNMKRGIPTIGGLKKTVSLIKDADVVQTWMYHADLLGVVACKIARKKELIWGVHHSNLDKDKNKKLVLYIAKINSYLSKYPQKIVSCSEFATHAHIQIGYKKEKFINIPNGFDVSQYTFHKDGKEKLYSELGIKENKRLICHVARWDILKDYYTLTQAFQHVVKENKNVELVLCGSGIDNDNKELVQMLKNTGIEKDTHLLGRRNDIPKIMSASEILVLSSSGEAFPNVIGEAMACQTPCVVTDVGDCKYIVGETGLSVPKQQPAQLAEVMLKMLSLPEVELERLGVEARKRITENFEIKKVVKMYEKLY